MLTTNVHHIQLKIRKKLPNHQRPVACLSCVPLFLERCFFENIVNSLPLLIYTLFIYLRNVKLAKINKRLSLD